MHAYSLTDLFGDSLTLVIPDIQRDFTWGGDQATVLVSGLAHVHRHGAWAGAPRSPMGMVYGYTSNHTHIHIIDGQQRLTTLYLLLGMLYRRTRMPELRPLLVNDDSPAPDGLPRILYQSKKEAFYFMIDLVHNFFLNRDGRLSMIEKSPWYCTSYASDVSVQSFIGALRHIDEVLETFARYPDWDFEAFTRFVMDKIVFRYCDLITRKAAERMYVTINTTGEPLTLAQNLRALHLAIEHAPESLTARWNEMEHWFWLHRSAATDSADVKLDKFLQIAAAYVSITNDIDMSEPALKVLAGIKSGALYGLFKAYERIADALGHDLDSILLSDAATNAPLRHFLILPALEYAHTFPHAEAIEISRFWRYIVNISRYQRPSPTGSDAKLGIELARRMPSADIISILDMRHVSERLLNDEEREKLRIIQANLSQRAEIEELFERAEAHPLLNGRIEQPIKWSLKKGESPTRFIEQLRYHIDEIYRLFGLDINRQDSLDVIRRVMLTLHHPGYPIVRRGDSVLSMCWHDYDWQRLMLNSPGIIRLLIDRIANMPPEEIIKRYERREDPYYQFIKDPSLLGNCRKKQLIRPCEPFIGYYDLKAGYTRWMICRQSIKLDPALWSPWRTYGKRCLYSDHRRLGMAIEIYYTPDMKTPFRIECFMRTEPPRQRREKDYFNLAGIATPELGFRYNRRRNRYTAIGDTRRILLLLDKLTAESAS